MVAAVPDVLRRQYALLVHVDDSREQELHLVKIQSIAVFTIMLDM
jgi:hypothetical protein